MKLEFSWYIDSMFENTEGQPDAWSCYVTPDDDDIDTGGEYASIRLLEDGSAFYAEVGTCGMFGGELAHSLSLTLDEAMESAAKLYVDNFYGEDFVEVTTNVILSTEAFN